MSSCGSNIGRHEASAYPWQLPVWLPPPLSPADNPMTLAKVSLGERLFSDPRLSFNATTSCASCHRAELAFTDGLSHPLGATGEPHRRSSMSLVNSAYAVRLGWADPRIRTIEAQIRKVLYNTNPVELGWVGYRDSILSTLAADVELKAQFDRAFPDEVNSVNEQNLTKAIASYVRTLIEADSAYERWLYFDDASGLSVAARRGMQLFFSPRVGCSNCHHGVNFDGVALTGQRWPAARYANTGLADDTDQGLSEQTGRLADRGRFRVPTLRSIAQTAPYMHDGRLASLAAVIDHYAGLDKTQHSTLDAALGAFELTHHERDDLVAFLEAL